MRRPFHYSRALGPKIEKPYLNVCFSAFLVLTLVLVSNVFGLDCFTTDLLTSVMIFTMFLAEPFLTSPIESSHQRIFINFHCYSKFAEIRFAPSFSSRPFILPKYFRPFSEEQRTPQQGNFSSDCAWRPLPDISPVQSLQRISSESSKVRHFLIIS